MLQNTPFERNGLKLVATTHATYIAIRVFDNKYVQSVSAVTNIFVDNNELIAIYNAITRSRFVKQSFDSLTFEPTNKKDIIKLTVNNHEFELEYVWLEQVFKLFLSESKALE